MKELLRRCIDEDGGIDGDVTSQSIIEPELQGKFSLDIRGFGTIAGLDPIASSFDFFENTSIELIFSRESELGVTCPHLCIHIQS